MTAYDARTGIELLDRDTCLGLLAADVIGRIAVVDGGAAHILPVNYALDGDVVVFRTDPGTKLDAGPRGRVAFEIDAFDRARHTGWSVVVAGRLEEVDEHDTRTVARLRQLDLAPWAGGVKGHWMRLVPERITGRRVGT